MSDSITMREALLADIAQLKRERDEALRGREAYKQLAMKHGQERDEAREKLYRGTVRHDDPTQRELSHLAGVVGALRDRSDQLMGLLRDVERETRQPGERFDEVWAEVREVLRG